MEIAYIGKGYTETGTGWCKWSRLGRGVGGQVENTHVLFIQFVKQKHGRGALHVSTSNKAHARPFRFPE
jgi:hypothetical protein